MKSKTIKFKTKLNNKYKKQKSFIKKYQNIIKEKEKYFCKLHNKYLSTFDILKRHIKEQHSDYAYKKCEFCLEKVKRLYQHYKFCKIKKKYMISNLGKEANTNKKNNNNLNINEEKIEFDSDNFLDKNCGSIIKLKNININSPKNLEDLYSEICMDYNLCINPKIKKYNLISCFKLGEGSYGMCFFGFHKKSKNPCAIKVPFSVDIEGLKKEKDFLEEFYDIDFLPRLFSFETKEKISPYLAEELMGPNLRQLYNFCGNKFDIKTIYNIGIDILSSLNAIHKKEILHLDMKPTNICWNIMNNYDIYPDLVLVDYGISIYINKIKHKKIKVNQYYERVQEIEGITLSKKQEIITLIYILYYLYLGKLPEKIINIENINKINKILDNKRNSNFVKELPEELQGIGEIYIKVLELKFGQEPDYLEYQKILKNIIGKLKIDEYKNLRFLWEKKIIEMFNEAEELKNPEKIKENIYDDLFKGYPKKFVNYIIKEKYGK